MRTKTKKALLKTADDAANEYAYKTGYPSAEYSSELHKAFMAGASWADPNVEIQRLREVLKSVIIRTTESQVYKIVKEGLEFKRDAD